MKKLQGTRCRVPILCLFVALTLVCSVGAFAQDNITHQLNGNNPPGSYLNSTTISGGQIYRYEGAGWAPWFAPITAPAMGPQFNGTATGYSWGPSTVGGVTQLGNVTIYVPDSSALVPTTSVKIAGFTTTNGATLNSSSATIYSVGTGYFTITKTETTTVAETSDSATVTGVFGSVALTGSALAQGITECNSAISAAQGSTYTGTTAVTVNGGYTLCTATPAGTTSSSPDWAFAGNWSNYRAFINAKQSAGSTRPRSLPFPRAS